jgi:hypothetical protein
LNRGQVLEPAAVRGEQHLLRLISPEGLDQASAAPVR